MRTAPAGFPDDVSLGTLLELTKTGWRRSFAARGPVSLAGRTMALEAAPAALDHLAALPSGLRGLSLAGLEVTDDEVAVVVRRLPALTWLDLRDTAVTAQVLTSVRRLRRLRTLGLNQAVLTEARSSARPGRIASGSGRVASGFGRIGRRTGVVTEGAVLVPWHSGLPEPDAGGFNAVLNAAVDAYPELGGVEPDEARVRAAVLLDAGRPEQGLAVLAPMLVTGDPGVVLVAARCVNEIGTAAQALAPLALGPPTSELLAWRAIFLSRTAPAHAVAVAQVTLRETPGDTAALWAICSAYLNAGQSALAARALADLQAQRPGWADAAKLEARLARSRRHYRAEIDAWQRVLAEQPDDADALAGLARAQRSARPLSTAWMTTLNRAATADMNRHGTAVLEQVTRHRRQLARLIGTVVAVAALLVTTATPVPSRRAGLVLLIGLLTAQLTAGLLWWFTPAPVRVVIRRTDQLTGTRRGANWRRPLLGGLLVALAVAVPIEVPQPRSCGGPLQQDCRNPVVAPTMDIPAVSISASIPPMSHPTASLRARPFSSVPVPGRDHAEAGG